MEIKFSMLAFGQGRERPTPVAMLNSSGAVVLLLPDRPARNMRRDETAESVAREILGIPAAKAA